MKAHRSVDDEVDFASTDQVDDVRPSVMDLEDNIGKYACIKEVTGCAPGGEYREAEFLKLTCNRDDCRTVLAVHANYHASG